MQKNKERIEKIASVFINRLCNEGASVNCALEILSMAQSEIARRDFDFRFEHFPETLPFEKNIKSGKLPQRTVWLREIFNQPRCELKG